jgi:hypothetical protein
MVAEVSVTWIWLARNMDGDCSSGWSTPSSTNVGLDAFGNISMDPADPPQVAAALACVTKTVTLMIPPGGNQRANAW